MIMFFASKTVQVHLSVFFDPGMISRLRDGVYMYVMDGVLPCCSIVL